MPNGKRRRPPAARPRAAAMAPRRKFGEAVVESLTLRAINRFGVPLFTASIAIIGWLAWDYFDAHVLTAITRYEQTNNAKLEALRDDLKAGRERGISAGEKLASTLGEVQKTLADVQRAAAAQQATATAQYMELKEDNGGQDKRLDRLENRMFDGAR